MATYLEYYTEGLESLHQGEHMLMQAKFYMTAGTTNTLLSGTLCKLAYACFKSAKRSAMTAESGGVGGAFTLITKIEERLREVEELYGNKIKQATEEFLEFNYKTK